MIKIFMNDGDDILLDLNNEEKERQLIYKFLNGLSPTTVLKLLIDGKVQKVPVSTINNMQFRPKTAPRKRAGHQERMDSLVNQMFKDFLK